jgi:uncharacterized protein
MSGRGRDAVEVRVDPRKGRGLYAARRIEPGERLDTAPVIVVDAADCRALDRTVLSHYYFHWDGDFDGDGRGAVALGVVTLCNHSPRPRARVERNYPAQSLDLFALEAIEAGEEITIDYGCELWFEAVE